MKTQQRTHLDQILVLLWVSLKVQFIEQVVVCSIQELIEDVEVPLAVVLVHNPRFLQQVVQDVTAHRRSLGEVPQNDGKLNFQNMKDLFPHQLHNVHRALLNLWL